MKHQASIEDKAYLNDFIGLKTNPDTFHHREHILITYTLLIDNDVEEVFTSIKNGILSFLNHLQAGTDKYHETLTYAWVLVVNHFMNISKKQYISFDDFIKDNQILLNQDIIYSHYSKSLLNSDIAKNKYVVEDLKEIPKH